MKKTLLTLLLISLALTGCIVAPEGGHRYGGDGDRHESHAERGGYNGWYR